MLDLWNVICSYLWVSLFLNPVALHYTPTGVTEEHMSSCLGKDTTWTIILYTEHSSVTRCSNDRMTQKYQGYIKHLVHFSHRILRRAQILLTSCSAFIVCSRFIHSGIREIFLHGEGRSNQRSCSSGLGETGIHSRQRILQELGQVCSWKPCCGELQGKTWSASLRHLHSEHIPPCRHFVHVCVSPVAVHHRSGPGDPLCCHKEKAPEEGPAAVLRGVWHLQVCSLRQQC